MIDQLLAQLESHAWLLGFGTGIAVMGVLSAVCAMRWLKRQDSLIEAQIIAAYARGRRRGMCESKLSYYDFDATNPPRD